MTDFIYDPEDGACIARMEEGKILINAGKEIATVWDGQIFGLDGVSIGDMAAPGGRTQLSQEFKKLLSR